MPHRKNDYSNITIVWDHNGTLINPIYNNINFNNFISHIAEQYENKNLLEYQVDPEAIFDKLVKPELRRIYKENNLSLEEFDRDWLAFRDKIGVDQYTFKILHDSIETLRKYGELGIEQILVSNTDRNVVEAQHEELKNGNNLSTNYKIIAFEPLENEASDAKRERRENFKYEEFAKIIEEKSGNKLRNKLVFIGDAKSDFDSVLKAAEKVVESEKKIPDIEIIIINKDTAVKDKIQEAFNAISTSNPLEKKVKLTLIDTHVEISAAIGKRIGNGVIKS
ncbi:MAG TPA: hypothetical protein DIV86_06555 [Alphaproteobacteria bacterium]|nr:hypothetical protein [Alphaproteobacteria bacterium]